MKHIFLAAAIFLVSVSNGVAGSATFGWKANTETDLAGYKIHYGPAPRQYDKTVDCGNVTKFKVENIPDGMAYYAATAYDKSGNESDFSSEVAHDPKPLPPGGMAIKEVQYTLTFAP